MGTVCNSWRFAAVLALGLVLAVLPGCSGSARAAGKKEPIVWVVLFFSGDCPHCRGVEKFLEAMKKKYPIRLKQFNTDQSRDYDLFSKLEEIHGEEKFAVPLVMVGDTILIGEDRILRDLEKTVRQLRDSGGAPLPYLGPDQSRSGSPSTGSRHRRRRPVPAKE